MIILQELFIHTAHAAAEGGNSPDIATMFGLNLKLFIAQLINFGIVFLVLWKWVFTPVTRALQARTKKIEDSLQAAETVTKEKEEFKKWKTANMAEARKEAAEIVEKSRGEAEVVRQELLAKAKTEQEKLLADGHTRLEQEQAQLLASARGQLAELVVSATEKILREKITDKKDVELAKEALSAIQ